MKVVCEKCESVFKAEVVKGTSRCPVCGASFDFESSADVEKEKHTYYYYKEGGGGLDDMLFDGFTPLYTFEAVNMEDAERQLKEVMPNSPLVNDHSPSETRCPYCRSREIQLVPKRFSILTGFATNRYDRMCVHCKRKF